MTQAVKRWNPGDQIVLREVWRDNVWSARPELVVRDSSELLALYLPAGSIWERPTSQDGRPLRMPVSEWVLEEARQPIETLRLASPGRSHSVLLLWREGFGEFLRWYVNLEDPLRRSTIGFDYMDQVLDIEICPDLTGWYWKDEDELREAQEAGLISSQRAAELRVEGEAVIRQMETREPPFNGGWERWRPDPSWPIPLLLDGWQKA